MAKKQNIYDKISYDDLRTEVINTLQYLVDENIEDLKDSINMRITNTGGKMPSVTVKLETKIDTQLITIESCIKILKSLLDKEGLTNFISLSIENLELKLKSIQKYYKEKPINETKDRMLNLPYGKNNGVIDLLASSKEEQIKNRTKINEKLLKLLPMIQELLELKESIQVRGGYEIPHRMKLKRNN